MQLDGTTRRVLVTGFEPFGGERLNPSQQAVEQLVAPAGVDLHTAILPVVFRSATEVLLQTVRDVDPELVLCFGEAGGRVEVTPERYALNLLDARLPDNAGEQPAEEPVVADGPVAYVSTLPLHPMVAAMAEAGIPSGLSATAGAYVCNSVFYGLMHFLAKERPGVRGGFVHVPYSSEQVVGRPEARPSLPAATLADAVRICVEVAARHA